MPAKMAWPTGIVKPGIEWIAVLGCVVLWLAKFWLVLRLNINWDEFYFLTHVHAVVRGDLAQELQTAYTHLFRWLPFVGGDEVAQIRLARAAMVVLLGIDALLVARLASRWFSPAASWTAALAFLAMWPTLRHGGSFRADSLLLPLQLGSLVVLAGPRLSDRLRGIAAGALLGIATAISIKAVLLAPVVVVLAFSDPADRRGAIKRLLWLALAAACVAAALLGLHHLTMPGVEAGESVASAQGAWKKTIRDSPWFPRMAALKGIYVEDGALWLVAAAGLGWAIWRRQWAVVACALALSPIAFYRNAFPYYFVVMWGPACIAIAAAATGVQDIAERTKAGIGRPALLTLMVWVLWHGLQQLPYFFVPRQADQADLVAAVHEVFPEPVPYVDHSGMIASFQKANFFMSSWGVEQYIAAGQPFMPRAISRLHPPLLLINRRELMPGNSAYRRLLAADREILECCYQPYWGAIYIAGAAGTAGASGVELRVPFAGQYRIESPRPVRVEGRVLPPGGILSVPEGSLRVHVYAAVAEAGAVPVRLLWAQARLPPARSPPDFPDVYDPL